MKIKIITWGVWFSKDNIGSPYVGSFFAEWTKGKTDDDDCEGQLVELVTVA